MQYPLSMNQLMAYDGLVFDMDGTLINTMPVHAEAWQAVGEHFGYPFEGSLMYKLAGAPVTVIAEAIMQKYGMPLTRLDEVIDKKREVSVRLLTEKSELLPTVNVVKALHTKKPLALGTGSHRRITSLLMNKFELNQYFDAVVTSEDVDKHKPAPDTFLRCAELMTVNANKCLVFEDADLGVEAGLAAGMDVFDVRSNQLLQA